MAARGRRFGHLVPSGYSTFTLKYSGAAPPEELVGLSFVRRRSRLLLQDDGGGSLSRTPAGLNATNSELTVLLEMAFQTRQIDISRVPVTRGSRDSHATFRDAFLRAQLPDCQRLTAVGDRRRPLDQVLSGLVEPNGVQGSKDHQQQPRDGVSFSHIATQLFTRYSFEYSAWASLRIGVSESASFQRLRKSR